MQVFVGNSSEDPLPYKGHLDARGIVAHLDMLQRVRMETTKRRKLTQRANTNILSQRIPGTWYLTQQYFSITGAAIRITFFVPTCFGF